jgi:hypothetical protein
MDPGEGWVYRARAQQSRALAAKSEDKIERVLLLGIAEAWEALEVQREKELRKQGGLFWAADNILKYFFRIPRGRKKSAFGELSSREGYPVAQDIDQVALCRRHGPWPAAPSAECSPIATNAGIGLLFRFTRTNPLLGFFEERTTNYHRDIVP